MMENAEMTEVNIDWTADALKPMTDWLTTQGLESSFVTSITAKIGGFYRHCVAREFPGQTYLGISGNRVNDKILNLWLTLPLMDYSGENQENILKAIRRVHAVFYQLAPTMISQTSTTMMIPMLTLIPSQFSGEVDFVDSFNHEDCRTRQNVLLEKFVPGQRLIAIGGYSGQHDFTQQISRSTGNEMILTTTEAATRLGCSRQWVLKLLNTGQLKPYHNKPTRSGKRRLLFHVDDIIAYKELKTLTT